MAPLAKENSAKSAVAWFSASSTAEKPEASKEPTVNLIINGRLFYVPKSFANIHPGGNVILNYHNRDATEVFQAFHPSETTNKLMKYRNEPYHGKVDTLQQETLEFRKLRELAEKEGHFEASKLFFAYKFLELSLMYLCGIGVVLYYPGNYAAMALGGFLIGAGMSQAGWYSHDVLHHQVFHSRAANNALGYLAGNFMQGFSVTWWKNKHNTHHACSNVHGEDPDIDTVPFVAWDVRDAKYFADLGVVGKFWLRYQMFFIVPLMAGAQVSWRIQSIAQIPTVRLNRNMEALALAAHYVAYGAITYAGCGGNWLAALAFVASVEVFGGWGKALPFVLNHSGCEVYGSDHTASHVRLQVQTSRDVVGHPFIDFFMGGLNYQIEHHLFPDMPRHNLSKIVKPVKALCKKHDINYMETGLWQGYRQVYESLRNVAKLVK